ncbi:MAG TPA: hypothetical protein VIM69_04640 [Opitutaceae bacterium]
MDLHAFIRGDAIEVTCSHTSTNGLSFRARYAAAVLLIASVMVATNATLKAEQKNDLEVGLTTQCVVREGTEEKLVAPAHLEPGQVLQYTAAYHNRSQHTLANFAPTLPLPRGSAYIPASAFPAPTEASIDGQTFEPYPIQRIRKLNNGLEETVEVPASSYRALRWSAGDLSPAGTFTTSARVRVLANSD